MKRGYYRWANAPTSLWLLLISGLVFRGIIAYFLPAGFDEAYYFLYTQHLDWSYFDHPPAVALTAGLGVWATGNATPFSLRLGALAFFTASLWLLHATGEWLFGRRVGLISCAIASLTPLFLLSFGVLAAPDNALIFFWSLALYLCAREFFPKGYSRSHSDKYQPTARIILISLAIGLACLSKYHGFVLGLSLVGFCLASKSYRAAFRSRWLGWGLLVFGFTLFPLLYWNATHDWISFRFQLGDRFTEYGDDNSGYSFNSLLGVVLAQFGYLFPSIALPLWWTGAKGLFSQLFGKLTTQNRQTANKINFLLWSGLPVALGFTLVGGATHTFPAWPAPGLWSLVILLSYAATDWPPKRTYRWLAITAWTIGISLLFALAHITLGTLQKPSDHALFGGIVSIESDPSTELIDTRQLRQLFNQSDEFETATDTVDFVITSKYWLSGYIALAMPNDVNLPVTSFTPDPRGYAFWFDPQQWIGKDALFIRLKGTEQQEEMKAIAPYFSSVTPLTQIATNRGGEISKTFYLYKAKVLQRPYPYPY